VNFDTALGKAKLLAPAADGGVLAGTELNDFGIDLLRRLDSSGNLCASPTSIALALAMVRAGARGTTATEIDNVLHQFGTTGQASEIVALLKALKGLTDAGTKPADELDVANAVFSQKGMNLEQAYLDALSSGFGAGVGLLDFQNDPESARLTINQWASKSTKGLIPAVLQQGDITNATRIALADAIYLKAAWDHQFEPTATKSLPFTRSDGSKVSVPTMAIDTSFQYAAGTGYRQCSSPFKSSASMTFIVPDNMASFVAGLTAAQFGTIEHQFTARSVDLTPAAVLHRVEGRPGERARGNGHAHRIRERRSLRHHSGRAVDHRPCDPPGQHRRRRGRRDRLRGHGRHRQEHGRAAAFPRDVPHRQAVPVLHPGTLDGRHPLHGPHRRPVRNHVAVVRTNSLALPPAEQARAAATKVMRRLDPPGSATVPSGSSDWTASAPNAAANSAVSSAAPTRMSAVR